LPEGVRAAGRYELTVQKQSGTEAIPLQVTVRGAELSPDQDGALAPAVFTPAEIVYRTDLRTDRHLVVNVGR